MLKVTNKGETDLNDRFDGVDYSFRAGSSIIIGEDAARHIFGFGEPDKVSCLTRLGWMRSNQDYEPAMQRLGGFVFSLADAPDDNDVQQNEQGLAPLQPGTGAKAATDGVVDSSVPIPDDVVRGKSKGRSVLDQLGGG